MDADSEPDTYAHLSHSLTDDKKHRLLVAQHVPGLVLSALSAKFSPCHYSEASSLVILTLHRRKARWRQSEELAQGPTAK